MTDPAHQVLDQIAEYLSIRVEQHPRYREGLPDHELAALAEEIIQAEEDTMTSFVDCVCDGEGCRDCNHTGIVEAEAELVTLDDVMAEAENERA